MSQFSPTSCPKTLVLVAFWAMLLLFSGSLTGCRVWHRTRVSSASTLASRQYVQQAAESIEQKNISEAANQLELAVKENPQNLEARTMLADTLWNQNRRDKAILQMEEVVTLPDVTPELVVKLAWMYFEQENFSLAQKYVSLGLRHNAELADAWFLQGRIYELQGQTESALAAFHQAAFYDTDNGKIQAEIAEQYLKLQKPQRALEAAQSVQSQNPAVSPSADLLLYEGYALAQLNRHPDAVRVLTRANQIAPENTAILSALATSHYQNGNALAAYQVATRGLQLNPQDPECSRITRELHAVASQQGRSQNQPPSQNQVYSQSLV
ncbi:MAG: tetratricopeptide repeat protein, partial [Planctomycetia bacterium]|nr:tetratricopeptide repeat protein [Planctomycetia bacterium]